MNREHAARAAYLSGLIYESPSWIRDSVAVQFEFINNTRTDTQVGIFAYDDATYIIPRGTEASKWNWTDIYRNMRVGPVDWPAGGQAHSGYASGILSVWPDIQKALPNYPRPWNVGGHSLGGSEGTLLASQMAFCNMAPDATYTFGAPKCVDWEAARTVPAPFHRIVFEKDIAPTYPADWTGYIHPAGGNRWHLKRDGSLTFQTYKWRHTLRPWFNGTTWERAKLDHRVELYVGGLAER